jgi:hypothetical protein
MFIHSYREIAVIFSFPTKICRNAGLSASKAMSSANAWLPQLMSLSLIPQFDFYNWFNKSSIKNLYRNVESTQSCRTPRLTGNQKDVAPFKKTALFMSVYHWSIILSSGPLIPRVFSLLMSPACQTVSKARLMSRNAANIVLWSSKTDNMASDRQQSCCNTI